MWCYISNNSKCQRRCLPFWQISCLIASAFHSNFAYFILLVTHKEVLLTGIRQHNFRVNAQCLVG